MSQQRYQLGEHTSHLRCVLGVWPIIFIIIIDNRLKEINSLYYQCYNSVNVQKGGTAIAVPATPVPTALKLTACTHNIYLSPHFRLHGYWMKWCCLFHKLCIIRCLTYHTSTHKFCYIMKHSFPIKPPTDFRIGFITTQMTSY